MRGLWGRCQAHLFLLAVSRKMGSGRCVTFILSGSPPPGWLAPLPALRPGQRLRLRHFGRCSVWAKALLLWVREVSGARSSKGSCDRNSTREVLVSSIGCSWVQGGSRLDLKLGCGKLQRLLTWSQKVGGCGPEAARNHFPERPRPPPFLMTPGLSDF